MYIYLPSSSGSKDDIGLCVHLSSHFSLGLARQVEMLVGMACKLMSRVIIVFDDFEIGLHAIWGIGRSLVVKNVTAIATLWLASCGRINAKTTYTVLLPLIKKVALMPCWCNDFAKSYEYCDGPSSKVKAKTPALLQWSYRVTRVLLTAVIGAAETKQPKANAVRDNRRECMMIFKMEMRMYVYVEGRGPKKTFMYLYPQWFVPLSNEPLFSGFSFLACPMPEINCYCKAPCHYLLLDCTWLAKPSEYMTETWKDGGIPCSNTATKRQAISMI